MYNFLLVKPKNPPIPFKNQVYSLNPYTVSCLIIIYHLIMSWFVARYTNRCKILLLLFRRTFVSLYYANLIFLLFLLPCYFLITLVSNDESKRSSTHYYRYFIQFAIFLLSDTFLSEIRLKWQVLAHESNDDNPSMSDC